MRYNSAVMFVESMMMDDDEFQVYLDSWKKELEAKEDEVNDEDISESAL